MTRDYDPHDVLSPANRAPFGPHRPALCPGDMQKIALGAEHTIRDVNAVPESTP